MTKEVYRDLLITKLIPAIMERWPVSDRNSRKIFIQQDGVKNHIHEDDKLFNAALEENGVNAELYTQLANLPDVNLLDLGFFRAIHTLANGWVFLVHLCVFCVFFGALVCVWKVFFALSNIVNYRGKFIFVYKLRLQKHQPNPGRKST